MKKFIIFFIAMILMVFPVSADDIIEQTAAEEYVATSVTFKFDIAQYRVNKYSEAVFNLGIGDKTYTSSASISRESNAAEITFEVEPYAAGTEMTLTPVSGIYQLQYYDRYINPGESVQVSTYVEATEYGPVHNTTFHMTVYPLHYKDVDVFVNYQKQNFTQPTILVNDQHIFVPVIELAHALGIEDAAYNKDENAVRISVNGKYMVYYLGSRNINVNGTMMEGTCETKFMYSTIFAPLDPFAQLFGSDIFFTDEGTHFNLNLDTPAEVIKYRESRKNKEYVVNERGIDSETDYLVWVSKSEFLVRVFIGSKGNWKCVNSFPCAIGAPKTPTIEGEFRYYQYQKRWEYNKYYCGPIMRFKGGYAIHSTLIKYDGTPYDNRVGEKISHGCVRVRPENIKWLVNYVPLYSKIYVTA